MCRYAIRLVVSAIAGMMFFPTVYAEHADIGDAPASGLPVEAYTQPLPPAYLKTRKYYRELGKRITAHYRHRHAWDALGTAVVVAASVDDDGNVQSVTLDRSSGDSDWDRAAMDAVQAASPLPFPPDAPTKRKFLFKFGSKYAADK